MIQSSGDARFDALDAKLSGEIRRDSDAMQRLHEKWDRLQ